MDIVLESQLQIYPRAHERPRHKAKEEDKPRIATKRNPRLSALHNSSLDQYPFAVPLSPTPAESGPTKALSLSIAPWHGTTECNKAFNPIHL